MRSSEKKRMKHMVSVGMIPGSAMGEWGRSSKMSGGVARDCSVILAEEEKAHGAKGGQDIYAKMGPGLDPNTHSGKGIFDQVTDIIYRNIYTDAPKTIPHANHPCAHAWLRIRSAVANSYRNTVIENHGASGRPSVNLGFKGADNKPIYPFPPRRR